MKCAFSIESSMVSSQNRVLTPLKRTSKTIISSFVRPSKIFVWGAQSCYKKLIAPQKNQNIASSHAIIFCNHIAKLLQKIMASQKPNTSHNRMPLSFVIILQSCYKRSQHPRKTKTSHHMLLLSFVSSCKVFTPQTKICEGRTNLSE